MASRQRQRGAAPTFTERARRAQLMESTIDVVAAKGYAGTSLSAIAEHAGVSKAAVLYHFASKDELIDTTFAHVVDEFTAYVRERTEAQPDPRAALVAYLHAMIGYQGRHRGHVRLITEALLDDRGGTRFRQPGQHDVNGRWQHLAGLLAAGQEAGRFRAFDTKTVALAIGGAIDNIVSQWLVDPALDLDAAAAELEAFVLAAVVSVQPG